ncbi:GreA/GreB family elongation factor, partial [Saezia sanguinis]|uniref:GreA/GreB family elongation factor n=1 Tax=Saezia sanguinis TaxID=1965230 RepID=UPI00194ED0A2
VTDTKVALDGARYILMERFAEDAGLLAKVRDYLAKNAVIVSKVIEGKVFFGAWVELEDEEGEVKQYRLVGCDEFDPAKNWISIDS